MEIFETITINRNGVKLYLKANGDKYKWTTNKNSAIWFEPLKAKEFAVNYFKGCNDWEIEDVNYDTREMKIVQ